MADKEMKIAHDVIDSVRYTAVLNGKTLHMLYTRPDDDRPWTGDVFAASVIRYASAQRAYFVDLGEGREAFMPHKDGKAFPSGGKIIVRVERPQTREKNIRCSFIGETKQTAGLMTAGDDDIITAKKEFPEAIETQDGLQDFDRAIIALQDSIVPIKQGLEIVIEHTAAFTAVDINNADPDLKPFEANRLAMAELARQMRLRNLSGQILADCLRLQNPEQRTKLFDAFKDDVAVDPRKVDLYGFTRLGLFELTRARNGLSLADIIRL